MDVLNNLILGKLKLSQALYYVTTIYCDSFETDFVEWAEQECYGYKNSCALPEYRDIDCEVYAKYNDDFGNEHYEQIDVKIIDEYLLKNGAENALVSKMRISQGIESLENSIEDNKGGSLIMLFPSSMSEMIKQYYHFPSGCQSFSVYQKCHLEQGLNIITEVKKKLINTLKVIELGNSKLNVEDKCICKPLIFISHASKDRLILKAFVDNILKKGLGLTDDNIVFTSYEATGVVPGDNIPNYIKNNIEGANIVLAMVSYNYKASEVCMNEVGAAWALGKTPIQIMLPNTNIDQLGWLLHLDKAARIDDRESLDSLEEVICNGMGIAIPTAKHWNPCTKDFLDALKSLPDLYNDNELEFSVMGIDGSLKITCMPKYKKIYYLEKNTEFKTKNNQRNIIVEDTFKGLTSPVLSSWQKYAESVKFADVNVYHEINYSKVKINLLLKNNSNTAIENGKIILWASSENIIFSRDNVIEYNSILPIPNLAIYQHIDENGVNEEFQKPINPTAVEELNDFFISAPHDIKNFQLYWKLESLKEPKFGTITIEWNPMYIEENEVVDSGDEKIGTVVIKDYIVEE